MKNAILLAELGVSLWYDHLRRSLVTSGELARLVREDGVTGVASNLEVLAHAVSSCSDYDGPVAALVARRLEAREIYDQLVLDDVRGAADVLRPVHEATGHRDGWVSVPLCPDLAESSEAIVAQGRELWASIGRANVMIEIPAADHGLPALRDLTAEGIPVAATAVFTTPQLQAALEAYLAGLEALAARGEPLGRVASVVRFPIGELEAAVHAALLSREGSEALRGRAGLAGARLAYARCRQIVAAPRWQALARLGSRPPRLAWTSTGVRNLTSRDTRYVEELVFPDTVSVVSDATLRAFLEHGKVAGPRSAEVSEDLDLVEKLNRLGVDLEALGARLQQDGLEARRRWFEEIVRSLDLRRQALVSRASAKRRVALGDLAPGVERRLALLAVDDLGPRLWKKDPSLWTEDPASRAAIKSRLGWLTSIPLMREAVSDVVGFAETVRGEGCRHVVLCGMGGSSLAAEVLARTFGPAPGYPELRVLDSTLPQAVREVERDLDLERTLFLISSKSGTTTEVNAFRRYFAARAKPSQLVAITDPGTPLEALAKEAGFRRIFLNPGDIGGRYSALSFFGLVPGALVGVDVATLLERAERLADASAACVPPKESPGAWLGAVLGEAARQECEKVTFLAAKRLNPLGAWIEQLLAESTGKEGKGIVPICNEPVWDEPAFADDRLFVALRLAGEADGLETTLSALEKAGHPVVELRLNDLLDLGAEFFRWELATAVAAAVLGVNAFDEPNVAQSKEATAAVLLEFERRGELPSEAPTLAADGIQVYGGQPAGSPGAALAAHLSAAVAGDYVALQAFLVPSDAVNAELQELRRFISQGWFLPTTLGYGPRYLHSTGQLHKGGPPTGVFVQLTADPGEDLAIPGVGYGFATLSAAQAAGDLRALRERELRVIRIHLPADAAGALAALRADLAEALRGWNRPDEGAY